MKRLTTKEVYRLADVCGGPVCDIVHLAPRHAIEEAVRAYNAGERKLSRVPDPDVPAELAAAIRAAVEPVIEPEPAPEPISPEAEETHDAPRRGNRKR